MERSKRERIANKKIMHYPYFSFHKVRTLSAYIGDIETWNLLKLQGYAVLVACVKCIQLK